MVMRLRLISRVYTVCIQRFFRDFSRTYTLLVRNSYKLVQTRILKTTHFILHLSTLLLTMVMNLHSHTIASAFYGIYSISGISARIRVLILTWKSSSKCSTQNEIESGQSFSGLFFDEKRNSYSCGNTGNAVNTVKSGSYCMRIKIHYHSQ